MIFKYIQASKYKNKFINSKRKRGKGKEDDRLKFSSNYQDNVFANMTNPIFLLL